MIAIELDDETHRQVSSAIRMVRNHIRWKPGKGQAHLRTRRQYGHLPLSATLSTYEAIIRSIIWNRSAEVYLYRWGNGAIYPTILGESGKRMWLVMCGLDGVMETAFPPTDVEEYLSDSRFVFLGLMQELSE